MKGKRIEKGRGEGREEEVNGRREIGRGEEVEKKSEKRSERKRERGGGSRG